MRVTKYSWCGWLCPFGVTTMNELLLPASKFCNSASARTQRMKVLHTTAMAMPAVRWGRPSSRSAWQM
ncbi:4Fe-4S binding protein [Ralstonia nicotianae]